MRWRRQDLQRRLAERFGVELHERTVGKYLAMSAIGGSRCARGSEGRSGGAGRFQKDFRKAVAAAVPQTARAKPLGILVPGRGAGRPAGHAHPGLGEPRSRPRAPRDTRYEWAYIFGAVCPGRGVAAGLLLPFVDTAAMNAPLAEIARTVAPGAHAVLVSTEPAGMAARRSSCPTTSRSSPCRPTVRS